MEVISSFNIDLDTYDLNKFENDKAIVAFALKTIQEADDPDDLICSTSPTLCRASLKSLDSKSNIFG